MLEPPNLPDTAITDAVEAGYGIAFSALTFLPLGADSASAVYRAHGIDGAIYFLKVRARHLFSPPSLLVPLYLHERGVPHVLMPLLTIARSPWVALKDFVLSLFPFVEGRMGADAGLSERHWTELGTTVRQIHQCELPSDLMDVVPRESFTPSRREVIVQLEAEIDRHTMSDPVQIELAGFWNSRRKEIRSLVDRTDALALQLRRASSQLVLCHADLHTWNILLDAGEQLWLVDWDETTFALKERDLMFVIGGIRRGLVSPRETACFLRGYGQTEVDPKALAYYRHAWAVQDMGAYGEQVFFSPGLGEESRRDALEGFMDMFEPGNMVDIAFASDDSVP